MRLKHRPNDFQVRELLREGYLHPRGRFRVYRVEKRKHTTLEAARALARLAGVPPAAVGVAGLKDRQGVTTQFMSVLGGRPVELESLELRIRHEGNAREALSSAWSEGNEFTILVRDVEPRALDELERRREELRRHGLVDYFGPQRFGNLEHGQGWIARELALGRADEALHALLAAPSARDDEREAAFKRALDAVWGEWSACREVALRHRRHRSIFEHLEEHPRDCAGAFRYVASRLRLIHLYAWQSHLWNRAVAQLVARATPAQERLVLEGIEGPLVFHRGEPRFAASREASFRLPGPRLEDVADPVQRALLVETLSRQGLRPQDFDVRGVPGFQLKGEERRLLLVPQALALRVEDARSGARVRLRFRLPRGAYATLVVARLLEPAAVLDERALAGEVQRGPGPAARRAGEARGGERGERGGRGAQRARGRGARAGDEARPRSGARGGARTSAGEDREARRPGGSRGRAARRNAGQDRRQGERR